METGTVRLEYLRLKITFMNFYQSTTYTYNYGKNGSILRMQNYAHKFTVLLVEIQFYWYICITQQGYSKTIKL